MQCILHLDFFFLGGGLKDVEVDIVSGALLPEENAEGAGGWVKITSVHLYPADKTREPFGIILMHRRIRESYANVRPLKYDFVRLRASFAGG